MNVVGIASFVGLFHIPPRLTRDRVFRQGAPDCVIAVEIADSCSPRTAVQGTARPERAALKTEGLAVHGTADLLFVARRVVRGFTGGVKTTTPKSALAKRWAEKPSAKKPKPA